MVSSKPTDIGFVLEIRVGKKDWLKKRYYIYSKVYRRYIRVPMKLILAFFCKQSAFLTY